MAGIEFRGEPFLIRLKIREYSSQYETSNNLMQISKAKILPNSKVLVMEDKNVYQFDANATNGVFAPFDNSGMGFWVLASNNGYISFDLLQKVRAHIVNENSSKSMLAFSNLQEDNFKLMESLDPFTKRLIVEGSESEKFELGQCYLEIHKYMEDNRFQSNNRIEVQKIKLWKLKDSRL